MLLGALPSPASAAPARAGVDWSARPRWRLPERPRVDCPGARGSGVRGWFSRARQVRCPSSERVELGERPPKLRTLRPGIARQLPATAVLGGEIDPRRISARPAPRPTPRPSPGDPSASQDANEAIQLSATACREHLDAAEAIYTTLSDSEAPEVAQPVRVLSLEGVDFVIPWSTDLASDHHAIWDCRLAVAMLPLARWLGSHGVTEVQYVSALRRGAIARQKPRSQHNRGLAIDIIGVVSGKPDSKPWDVQTHYPRGRMEQCPATAALAADPPLSPAARLLANFVCTAVRRGSVHTLLTPDHDAAHEDHLHLDLKAGQPSPVDPFVSYAGEKPR